MVRSAAGKVMWVGRATVFLVGLAVILALVFGVATSALGANGKPFLLGKKNVASAISTLVKQGTGPALKLQVGAGQPPMAVNSPTKVARLNADRIDDREAASFANGVGGVATNADKLDNKDSSEFLGKTEKAADADKLDGIDSDQMLPLVRAQKDGAPCCTQLQSASSVTANTVSITTPTEGFLIISGSMQLYNSSTGEQEFLLRARLDGTDTAGQAVTTMAPSNSVTPGFNVTVPVSPGQHTVTSELQRLSGSTTSGSWYFNRNNLTVMFVHADRGAVTDHTF